MSGGTILTAPSEANRSHQPSCYAASLPVFGKVTRRGSNESSGSRHAAGISAILKWSQTCVVNQPVLSSKTSGEPKISHFELAGILVDSGGLEIANTAAKRMSQASPTTPSV